MKNLLSIICLTVIIISTVRSQSVNISTTGDPLVNQLCPEFSFDTLFSYKKEKLALSEFRGKFVIVDFWATFCLPCIADFPKLENLQKRFGDTLQVLLVATDGYVKTKQFYNTRKKTDKPMTLPCAINRSMVKYFQIKQVSTYVWIDDQGYIKAITDYTQLTEQNIADFIGRKKMMVREKEKRVIIDSKKPLLIAAKEIDSNSVIFGSVLTKYLKGVGTVTSYGARNRGRIYAYNMPIMGLYMLAFGDTTGTVLYSRVAIESAHMERFMPPKKEDFDIWRVDNTYCYELTVPESKQKDIFKIMREDLGHLFGYNAYQEYRTQKCLVLKAEKGFHYLEDTTVAPKLTISSGGVTVTNYLFPRFSGLIDHYNQDKIFFDETGLTGKVDITIQAMMNDVDALNKELKKYGLSLHYEDRQVQMLVIKDPL
jgi:thiol-disulfide isomerase/thioredoxin